jgi:hypothetical protein
MANSLKNIKKKTHYACFSIVQKKKNMIVFF